MSNSFIDNEIAAETNNATEQVDNQGDVDEKPLTNGLQGNEYQKHESGEPEATTKEKSEWTDLLGSGAIMKKIIKEGKPDTKPQRNDKCTINYTCFLEDETIVENAQNFELYLGESDVIQGLDVSLGLMNTGEKCRLRIEPRLAFGKKGLPPHIPGDTVVVYDVEMVSSEAEADVEMLTVYQRKIIGNKKRERGNWWYCRGENNIAIQCYRRALDYLDEVECGITESLSESAKEKSEVTDADLQNLLEDRISVCNNMAAAQIKMEMYEPALNSLQIVLRCQPNNVKAHFRKAKVYLGKNDLPMAMKSLLKARELSPSDIEIQKEINAVQKILEKQKVSERELARRMFNGPKKSEAKSDTKKNNKNKVNTIARNA